MFFRNVKSKLVQNQPSRSSPRLAKLNSAGAPPSHEQVAMGSHKVSVQCDDATENTVVPVVEKADAHHDESAIPADASHPVSKIDVQCDEAAVPDPQFVDAPASHLFEAAPSACSKGSVSACAPILTDAVRTTTAVTTGEAVKSVPWVDGNGNVFVPASTLFSDLVAGTTSNIQGVHDEVAVGGVEELSENASQAVIDESLKSTNDAGVSSRVFVNDIEPPMWNFSSQSPEVAPVVAPPQTTALAILLPPTAYNFGDSGMGSIPEAIPTSVPAAGTSSSNEPPVGDLSKFIGVAQPLPLSWAPPGNLWIPFFALCFVILYAFCLVCCNFHHLCNFVFFVGMFFCV